MYSLGYSIFSLVALLHMTWPILLVVLIVALASRSNGKKTEFGRVKPGEVLMDDEQAAQNKHESNKRLNILLYLGSFFIAGSMFLLAKDAPTVMPIILVLVSVLVYSAGLILYKAVDYLQPVATAFTYTGLVLFPIWYYAFNAAGLPSQTSLMISSIVSFIASLGATLVVESRVAGWLSFIWLTIAGWTVGNVIDETCHTSISAYSFFIWPLIVSILPTICWSARVKWLPVAFRKATKFFATVVTPLFAILAMITLFTPNMGHDYPALRTSVAVLATIHGLIGFIAARKRGNLMALRIYTQFFIIALFSDISNFSIITTQGLHHDVSSSLLMTIVWLASFLLQTVLSLFLPQRNEEEQTAERRMLVISLIGLFATGLFTINFETVPRAITLVSLASVIAVLGILISLRNKDIRWCITTFIACMYIPLELGLDLASPIWNGWVFFFIYAILTMVFVLAFALVSLSKPQTKRSSDLLTCALVLGNFACIASSAAEGWAEAGWLVSAIDVALAAAITRRLALFEAASYLGAFALFALLGNLMKIKEDYYLRNSASLALNALRFHIIALPVLGFGFVKERKEKSGARLVLGYIALTLPLFIIATAASAADNYLWPVIFIVEQVVLVIAGILTKRTWLVVAPIVFSVITTLELTNGLSSIWLLLIGIGLIAFVTWQLVKNSKKQ